MKTLTLPDKHVKTITIETHNDFEKFLLWQGDDCISMSREQFEKLKEAIERSKSGGEK